jgi:enoyl-CoA hydratase/carnithine racemase
MTSEPVLLDNHQGIALITLNRPDQLNTFDAETIDNLGACLRECDLDDAVRVVVLTGSGKAFCAGADLSGGGATFDEQETMTFSSCALSMQPWAVRKPVIAACNGHAIGVGLSTALQCDLRLFAEEGKYGLLQNRRGVVADNAVEYLLPRLVGFERAFELVVRAVRLTGAEAGEWGLAGRVLPAAEVLPAAMEIAEDMATNCSPLVMGMHKRMLWRALDMDRDAFVALETWALHYSMGREDAVEGGLAYVEKRAPEWCSSLTRDWPTFLDD